MDHQCGSANGVTTITITADIDMPELQRRLAEVMTCCCHGADAIVEKWTNDDTSVYAHARCLGCTKIMAIARAPMTVKACGGSIPRVRISDMHAAYHVRKRR